MSRDVRPSLDELYGSGVDHDAFNRALETSLNPRGPDMLFDMVARLALPLDATVLDVGCRHGRHAIEIARRFGLTVHGIDPLERHISRGRVALAEVARQEPEVASHVRLSKGNAERLPAADGSVDLIWCRDVLVHVKDLVAALREGGRVLGAAGHILIFQMFATEWLEPHETERLWPGLGVFAENTDPRHFEAAIGAAGLRVVELMELRSEWREHLEEDGTHRTSRQLLHAARLLRGKERFIAEFGTTAYDFELGDCLWGVYQMIGKLSPRVYLLAH